MRAPAEPPEPDAGQWVSPAPPRPARGRPARARGPPPPDRAEPQGGRAAGLRGAHCGGGGGSRSGRPPCPLRAPERRCGAPEALVEPGRPFNPQRHHCPALGGPWADGSLKRRGPGRLCLVGSWDGRGMGKDSSWACTAAPKAIYRISLKLSKMKPFIGGI